MKTGEVAPPRAPAFSWEGVLNEDTGRDGSPGRHQPLADFQRASIARLKRTGRAAVLTVGGEAEIVVQDAPAYQRLVDRVAEADRLLDLRRSIAECRSGRVRDLDTALDEVETRHLGPKQSGRPR